MKHKYDDPDNFQEQFDEWLDESYPDYTICDTTIRPSQILKKCDPVAYNQALLNYVDSLERGTIDDEWEDQEFDFLE